MASGKQSNGRQRSGSPDGRRGAAPLMWVGNINAPPTSLPRATGQSPGRRMYGRFTSPKRYQAQKDSPIRHPQAAEARLVIVDDKILFFR